MALTLKLIILFLLFDIFQLSAQVIPKNEIKKKTQHNTKVGELSEPALDTVVFHYAIGSICQEMKLFIPRERKKDIALPTISFQYTLSDSSRVLETVVFKGVAVLFSDSEQFFEKDSTSDWDKVYFAVQYRLIRKGYVLTFLVDDPSFEACYVDIKAQNREIVLGAYVHFLKRYPQYDLMKRKR
jgi:hypothetical protein